MSEINEDIAIFEKDEEMCNLRNEVNDILTTLVEANVRYVNRSLELYKNAHGKYPGDGAGLVAQIGSTELLIQFETGILFEETMIGLRPTIAADIKTLGGEQPVIH